MNKPFAAAIQHIRLMETRIKEQQAAIERLKQSGEDPTPSASRLRLLQAALEEMRLQLARLVPSDEQVATPIWALPLVSADRDKRHCIAAEPHTCSQPGSTYHADAHDLTMAQARLHAAIQLARCKDA
jgi:hypothetical protein